ncbi:MAG: methionyl-tRNA formyltransferase, partial [Ketobacteraceae bacterium]|nr:methionyl-tRNA formyltransferase [Ketobacteraceae bacterium]
GALDWVEPATRLHDKIRGLSPWPVAHTRLGDQVLRVHESRLMDRKDKGAPGEILAADRQGIQVATGDGVLALTKLQLPGGKALPVADLLNSKRDLFQPGTLLG